MYIEIDTSSGFCFGVQKAIDKAEGLLTQGEELYCLGDMVHNREEVNRLTQLGMTTITYNHIQQLPHKTILLRSHGEPPSIYSQLGKNQNKIVDATCPVVLKLQQRIKQCYLTLSKNNGQLVIFGKKGHPEVIGLNGQTGNQAIVVSGLSDLEQIDFNRPIELYSQTTMSLDAFRSIKKEIENRATAKVISHDTICRQVANRVPHLKEFSSKYDVILFVSGKKSSNGKFLFEVCKKQNHNSYFISSPEEVDRQWLDKKKSIGICGATSTPKWLMEKVKQYLIATLNLGKI